LVNAGGILVGALGVLNPVLAAVLHNLSTIAVVGNSSRLIRYDPIGLNGRLMNADHLVNGETSGLRGFEDTEVHD
jgi:hypothetical protein